MSKEFEFTPEQQAHIDSLVAESTKGLFSQEDFDRELNREVDRRVESGIQKGLDTHKSKWQKEFEEQSRLTAEELAEKKILEKTEELEQREKELSVKNNTLEAKSMLAGAEIPKEHYEKFVGLLVSGDDVETKENVENFISTFNETKAEIERSIKENYSNVPSPKKGDPKAVGKEEFNKMTFDEKIAFKNDYPDLYSQIVG